MKYSLSSFLWLHNIFRSTKMLAQISDLCLCAIMSMRPYVGFRCLLATVMQVASWNVCCLWNVWCLWNALAPTNLKCELQSDVTLGQYRLVLILMVDERHRVVGLQLADPGQGVGGAPVADAGGHGEAFEVSHQQVDLKRKGALQRHKREPGRNTSLTTCSCHFKNFFCRTEIFWCPWSRNPASTQTRSHVCW